MAVTKDSILDNTKKLLGLDSEYAVFDLDIITYINATFSTLQQLGVGPDLGFRIEGPDEVWNDFLGNDPNLNNVKSYIYLRVRLLFDPPPTSFAITAMEKQATELEWRMNVYAETGSLRPEEVDI